MARLRTLVAAAVVCGSAATASAQDGAQPCEFCGTWTLDAEATMARQTVADGHGTLVLEAIRTMSFSMSFSPDGAACMEVSRQGETATEAVGWELAGEDSGEWRVRNTPPDGEPQEMWIRIDNGQLVLRQPTRPDEPLVFSLAGNAEDASAWCAERAGGAQ